MEIFNQILGWGTVALQVGLLVTLYLWWQGPRSVQFWLGTRAATIALILTVTGTVLSLIYSEWFNLPACNLCWYQRIFLYPQVILLFWLARQPAKELWRAISTFSIIGLIVAILNYGVQWSDSFGDSLFCSTEKSAFFINCQDKLFVVLGYITIPLMSATVFAFLFVLAGLAQKHLKQ